MNKEKLYMFNPFLIENASVEELSETYKSLVETLIDTPNTMYEYAHNIETYSNMTYIVGEVIARYSEEYSTLKTNVNITIDNTVATLREEYIKSGEKAPAMKYFESKATQMVIKDLMKMNDADKRLKRFKNSYTSLENKMNAIKKKMEAIKYEEFNS